MKAKPLHAERRRYVIKLAPGEEFVSSLTRFAAEARLGAGSFTAIGAFERVTLGFYDLDRKEYRRNEIERQVEAVSLAGNIAISDGKPKVHAHVVVADSSGRAFGGHLLEGRVRPTLEIILDESDESLTRRFDEASGLSLLDLEKKAA
jgi:predicted DNA-binding protein with PD1-like motif